MKSRSIFIFVLFLFSSVFFSCSKDVAEPPKAEWPYSVNYEIFVRAFADGSGNGIGDFKGLTSKLDYVESLGVQSIWLMPIHPSPSYHKYDVTDYRGIHPDYGTMEDFETFLAEAHARNIRVVIDLVINHSARAHPWFQAAIADPDGPFFDFYIWETEDNIESLTVEYTGPDSDNTRVWNTAEGIDKYYYAYFWAGMPDLNYDNRAVRDSIYAIGHYWLEKGVDGFRLDAAKHIYPDHRAADAHAFWEEFRAEMQKVNPDVLLVGEVWASTEVVKPFLTGLPSLFNFDLGYAIMDAVKAGKGAGLAERHSSILNQYLAVTEDFVDATFLTNHDQNRVMSVLQDIEKAKTAASILLTLPGSPYIYYGEEIGMYGSKPDPFIREPMLWTPEPDEMRSRWREPRHSTDATVRPVSEQLDDPDSILNHYKNLIHVRNASAPLTYGLLHPVSVSDERLVTFRRAYGDHAVFVVHNVSEESVSFTIPVEFSNYDSALWSRNSSFSGNEISLEPLGSIILSN